MDYGKTLALISRAWGRKQEDEFYCFFPWLDREEQRQAGTRRAGFHEGPAFKWPRDRSKIIAHMANHTQHDLYWCPSLFEEPRRATELATDEKALWADLDEVNPKDIQEYPPTIAWETSPGRYQALWLINSGDIQGASWPGNENQKLTYYIGADQSGWDTTQLLRIPGWTNHKYEYRDRAGKSPDGKLLWANGRTYLQDDFTDLPPVEGALQASQVTEVLATQIEAVDRSKVLARIRLKLTKRIRDLLSAREAMGDRSDVLWEMERSLADAGCSIEEIVAVVRGTVWNKHEGRTDEVRQLITEAMKAIAAIPQNVSEKILEEEGPKAKPDRIGIVLAGLKRKPWLVKNILTEGGVGFIAGEPKSHKSWIALDLALSVSTGARFLDFFDILTPGPVLYIQEEDSGFMVKDRAKKIWRGKHIDKVTVDAGKLFWDPSRVAKQFDPDINLYLEQGVTISEAHWQEWLDATLEEGMLSNLTNLQEPYKLLIIDTLMMVAGNVEENKSQAMTTDIFRPLKQLARKHGTAIQVVHHMRKANHDQVVRDGQRLLGSVANHAWSEDSMYLTHGKTDLLQINTESKSDMPHTYRVGGIRNDRFRGWSPNVLAPKDDEPSFIDEIAKPKLPDGQLKLYEAIKQIQPCTDGQLAKHLGWQKITYPTQLLAIERKGLIRALGRPRQWSIV